MKWFRHNTDASDNDFIEQLENQFGLEGYARYFKLCEIIGRGMDKTDKCSASHSWSKWQVFLKGKPNKLRMFLERLANAGKISLIETGNVLEISMPKLLEMRDDYSRKSGYCTSKGPDVVLPVDRDRDRERSADGYSFSGRVIRLNARDFETWQKAYSSIPDLRAELTAIDDKLFSQGDDKDWFHKVSGWLRSKHEKSAKDGMTAWKDKPQNRMPSPAGG